MNIETVLFPFLMAFILLVGCSENATESTGNTDATGDPEVEITVDWNSLNNASNKVKTNSAFSKTVSDSITHFGARLVYVNENAVFSQSVKKTTAEEEGIITLDVPATDEAKLFSVAVRKTENEERAYLLGAIKNLSIEKGKSYNWTVDDFSWENAEWKVLDSLKTDYENGVFSVSKNKSNFKMGYVVKNPFNTKQEVKYDNLIIGLNGTGGVRGYKNGYREYYIHAKNPNPGKQGESYHNFYPYLNSESFNLPTGRYVIGKKGNFTVRWE